MKVGLILECGPQGADKAVCEYLAKLLDPKIEVVSLTLDNKPGLIENCADAANDLFFESRRSKPCTFSARL